MYRFVIVIIFFVSAFVAKGQTPTFTFQCVCDYLTAADSTCDICNTTTQSRFFKGLLIYKNGVAHKWIEQPYTIIQNFDALTFRELIPGAEQIRIELRGTAFDSIAQFRDSVLCPCSGTSTGTTLIAGPGVNIWNDTIAAIPQQIDTFDLVSGTADTIRISLTRDSVPYHYVILPPDSDSQYIDTLQLTGTTLEISLSGDGQPLKTVDLSSLVADGDETIVTAGTGISVTGIGTAGNPYVITNTGDLSNTNELQNLFDTIAIAGQQSIVPNSQHTKLTLIEGVGVAITTDSTAREITIEADTSLLATVNDIDVITLADSAELKAYTGIARGVVLRQQGREGLFTRTTTSRAHDGYMVFEDAAARKWIRITEQDYINVKWFGAIGNGVADDQYAIQRAIDYTIYEDTTIKKVYLPKGKYLISAPLQMGYGAGVTGNFSSVSLLGDGTPPFRGEAGYAGTIIETNYSNAPAVNIQGARNSSIDNITFIGLNDITGGLSDTSSANINNWLDSGLHANANTRYAPYAAITVDAYSGTAPGTPYPNVTYPSYSGVSGQYSKSPSSHVKIRNVHIYEFVAGIVVQPNTDANGDFVQIEKAIIESCAYGISVGNSQSRNMRITDGYINAHTCITNSTHGAQVGRLTMIENVHFGGYQWFNLGAMPYVDGLQVNACYGESFYWLGQFGVGISGAFPPITFNSCRFQFGSLDSRTLSNAGSFTGNVAYMFNGCSFSGGRIYVFENNQLANLHFRQCTFSSTTDAGEVGALPSYYQYFYRSFGFVMSTYPQRTNVEQCRFFENGSAIGSPFPLTTGDGTAMPELMEYTSYWKKLNITGKDVQFADLGYSYDSYLGVGSAFSSTSITNRDFTGTLAAGFNKGIGIGDLLLFNYSNNTLLVMVDSISGSTVTGVTMNGYMYDGSGNYTNSLFSTTVTGGNVFHLSARKFINAYTITGDFVVGSTTVSNIKYTYNNSNASSAFIKHTPLMNADNFSGMSNWPVTDATYIDSVDTANNRFFLSAAAVEAGTFVIQNCLLSEGDNLGDHHLRKNLRTKDNWISNDGDSECLYPTTNARVGVNTSNPGAVVEITGASGLFGAYVNSSSTNVGNGYTYNGGTLASQVAFDFLGAPTSEIYGQIRSTGTGSAALLFQTPNANAGADPYIRMTTASGGGTWHIGIDNSDSDKLKIGQTGAPTSAINAAITITTADLVGISQRIPVRTLHVEGEARITDLTTDAPTRLVGADADGDLGAVALTGLTITGGTLIANDTSPTNELQTIDNTSTDTTHTVTLSNSGGSFQVKEGAGIAFSTSGTGLNGVLTISSTVTDTDDQNLTIEGSGPTYDIAISGGTDVTIQGGGIVTLSESPANTLIVTATEVDGSTSNELQTYGHAGTTTYTNTLSNGGGSFSITGAGINVVSQTAGAVTITGTEVDGSVTNEAWTVDADDADTEVISNQTVKFEGAGTVTTDYNPGTNTLLITGSSTAGLNGIYGDGTATSGNDTLPTGGSTVTIPGQWQPLQFNANTAGGEVWSALVVNAATCSDDRITKALVLRSPSDSLEIYNYDCGALIKETGGILTLETDRELWLIGDSINATTIPTRTVLPFLIGQTAAGWLQKIEGTTTGQTLLWDEPNGWWELGSAGGSGTVTGSGAAGQMAYWDGTTSIAGENNHWWDATNDRLGVGTNGGAVSSRVDVTTNGLGTSQTTTSGLAVVNTTAAAAGAQQISPAIRWSGAGWKTTATAASQAVEFRSYVTPIQGTTAPTGYLGFGSAINGSWTNDQFNINSGGEVGIGTTTFTGAGAFARLNVTGSSATVAPYLINAFTASSSGGTVYAQISNTQTASTTFLSLGEAADINAIKAGLRRYGSTHATLPNQLDLVNVGSAAVTLSTNLTVRMTVAADGTVHATNKLAAGFASTTGIHSTLQSAGSFAGARLETVAAPTFDATKHTVIYTASTNVSWTLPSAASCACDGRVYILHHAGTAGTITLSQTITKGNAGNFNTLTAGQWAYITYGAASIRGYKIISL